MLCEDYLELQWTAESFLYVDKHGFLKECTES